NQIKSLFCRLSLHWRHDVGLIDSQCGFGGFSIFCKVYSALPIVGRNFGITPDKISGGVHFAARILLLENSATNIWGSCGAVLVIIIDPISGPKLAAVGAVEAPVINDIVPVIEQTRFLIAGSARVAAG